MREPPSQSDPPAALLECRVARCERIDVPGPSSLVRVTVELGETDPRSVAGARLLVADGDDHRCHDALPAPVPAQAERLTLGFAVGRTAIAVALVLGDRSLALGDELAGDGDRAALDLLQLEALGGLSRQLRATQGRLTRSRVAAALMKIERDDARRAVVRAEAAAYDATAPAGTVTHAAVAPVRPARRSSRRTVVAACALSSAALALAVLGWPTRDGAPDPGVAGVAAASPTAEAAPATAAVASAAVASAAVAPAAAAAVLARRLQIPVDYLELYRGSARRYGLDWTRLAAVGAIESTHGQDRGPGVATGANWRGARGPAQFLVGTWERFGLDGDADGMRDPHDAADAIPAMASYLRASGAPQDWRAALHSYNHSDAYVDAVERLAARYRESAGRPATR
jgi:hypothetical protein